MKYVLWTSEMKLVMTINIHYYEYPVKTRDECKTTKIVNQWNDSQGIHDQALWVIDPKTVFHLATFLARMCVTPPDSNCRGLTFERV
jgi:hypothetical protein